MCVYLTRIKVGLSLGYASVADVGLEFILWARVLSRIVYKEFCSKHSDICVITEYFMLHALSKPIEFLDIPMSWLMIQYRNHL
jgi:hypothetical protein